MSRLPTLGSFALVTLFAATGCEGGNAVDIEQRIAALGGMGGFAGVGGGGLACPNGGGGGGSTLPNDVDVRGFTASGAVHTAVFPTPNDDTNSKATGTPLANWADLGGHLMPHASPWGYRRPNGADVIVYVDMDGHVHERGISGSPDVDFNLTSGINAPIAASAPANGSGPVPDVIGYVRSDQRAAVVYRSSTDHVIELKATGNTTWQVTDLTVASGTGFTATRGSAFPYVRSDGRNAIVYIGSNNHIRELSSSGSAWVDRDLSVAAGAATTAPGSEPWGYRRSDGFNAVLFVSSDSQLHEFKLFQGSSTWSDFTLPAMSPYPSLFTRPSGYVGSGGKNSVAYISGSPGSHTLRHMTLGIGSWDHDSLPPTCTNWISQPFGHSASGDRSSILFSTRSSFGIVTHYELSSAGTSSWTLATF